MTQIRGGRWSWTWEHNQGKPVLWAALAATCTNTAQSQGTEKAGRGGCSTQGLPAQLMCQGSVPQASPTSAWAKAGSSIPSSLRVPALPPGQLPTQGSCFGTALTCTAGRLDSPAVSQPGCPRSVTALCQKAKVMSCSPVNFQT